MQAKRRRRRLPEGVIIRHSKQCASASGATCNCDPSYRASAYDRRTKQKVYATFHGKGALDDAVTWRATRMAARHQRRITPTNTTLDEAAELFFSSARLDPPTVLTKSGTPYKPSVLRGWENDLKLYVLPDLGSYRRPRSSWATSRDSSSGWPRAGYLPPASATS